MFCLWVKGSDFKYNKPLCGPSSICFPLCPIDILWLSINNTHAGVMSHSWRVKVMHHKAGSFQSEFISQKCRVCIRLLASLQHKEEQHKGTEQKQRKHSQTGEAKGETRPGECSRTRPATGVCRRHKVLCVQGRAATWAKAPRTTRAPEPGAFKCAVAARSAPHWEEQPVL